MQEIATIIASAGFVFVTSFVLFSCLSCRRFLEKRRQKKDDDKEERVNIPEIKIDVGEDHQDKNENGITNPGYQETDPQKPEDSKQVVLEIEKEPSEKNDENETANVAAVEAETEKKADENNKQTEPKNDEQIAKNNTEKKEENEDAEKDEGVENKSYEDQQEETEGKDSTTIKERMADFLDSVVHNKELSDEKDGQSEEEEEDEKKEGEEEEKKEKQQDNPNDEQPSTHSIVLYENELSEEELTRYDGIIFRGEWRQPVALRHLLEIGFINKDLADEVVNEMKAANKDVNQQNEGEDQDIPEKVAKFLSGEEPVAGIILADTGEKKSIFKSAKDGILRRGTAISLLEAQAATGNIIDPVTGRKMSVKEATQLGLLDKVYETVLLRAERAVIGYKFRASEHVLSLYEAMQKGLVVESHGLRLLEAQNATGGIIDHRINIRLPLSVAVKRGLLDERLKGKLEDEDGEETKTFFDPNTEQNVTYRELMRRSVVDNDTGLRLYPLERMTKKRVNYGSYSGRSSLSSSKNASRSNSRENIPAAVASSLANNEKQ